MKKISTLALVLVLSACGSDENSANDIDIARSPTLTLNADEVPSPTVVPTTPTSTDSPPSASTDSPPSASTVAPPVTSTGPSAVAAIIPASKKDYVDACYRNGPIMANRQLMYANKSQYVISGEANDVSEVVFTDAPNAAGLPKPAVITGDGPCKNNQTFKFGTGRADILGPWAGHIQAGVEIPTELLEGMLMRPYARAFIIGESCSNKKTVIVNLDTSLITRDIREGVLEKIAADPQLKNNIDPQGFLITATHTHSNSGGHSFEMPFHTAHLGHEPRVYDAVVTGAYEAIKAAYKQYTTNPEGKLQLGVNELLNVTVNRDLPAFLQNPASERAKTVNTRGKEITTNPVVTQLNMINNKGQLHGFLNFFSDHNTAAINYKLLSGDNKGLSAYKIEKIFSKSPQNPEFVAGFFQSDQGDIINVRFVDKEKFPQFFKPQLPLNNPFVASMYLSGVQQLVNAVDLTQDTQVQRVVTGGIDYRLEYFPWDKIYVKDSEVLESLRHSPNLDDPIKRTCTPAFGLGFVRGKGTGVVVANCDAFSDLGAIFNSDAPLKIAAATIGTIGCQLSNIPALSKLISNGYSDYSCQKEKPILIPVGNHSIYPTSTELPVQIIKIGNLGILGAPVELTAMSGRQLREFMIKYLSKYGIDYLVINTFANDFAMYATTRDEYAFQAYEASFTLYGPWESAAVKQMFKQVAERMISNAPPPIIPRYYRKPLVNFLLTPQIAYSVDPPDVGKVVQDVKNQYQLGETLEFQYKMAYPNRDVFRNGSYFYIERFENGTWKTVATDADPETWINWIRPNETRFIYLAVPDQSEFKIGWKIPKNIQPGDYRIRYQALTKFGRPDEPGSYKRREWTSKVFKISGTPGSCMH